MATANSWTGSQVISTTKHAVKAGAKEEVVQGKDKIISNSYGCANNFSLYGRLMQGMKITTEDTDAARDLVPDEVFNGVLAMPALAAGRNITLPEAQEWYNFIGLGQHNIPETTLPAVSADASTLFPTCLFSMINTDDASDLTLTANTTDGTFQILGSATVAAGTSGLFAIISVASPTTAAGDDGIVQAVRIA